jgi:hypothetical protein
MQIVSNSFASALDTFAEPLDSYRLADYAPERRRHTRRRVRVLAEARRMDNTLAAQREPRFALTVLDVSTGGIAATSQTLVAQGERLVVSLPPEAGIARRIFGRVIRCNARRGRWTLAIAFDSIPAA